MKVVKQVPPPPPPPPVTYDLTELTREDLQTLLNALMALEWSPHNPNAKRLYHVIAVATGMYNNGRNDDGTAPLSTA